MVIWPLTYGRICMSCKFETSDISFMLLVLLKLKGYTFDSKGRFFLFPFLRFRQVLWYEID
jgi:hypothetical protein